jgi:hypothetical protein
MSNRIADTIVEEGGTIEEAISTTVVLLGLSTASLGFVLVIMGKFRIADIVAYLPLPVVGGYLACKYLILDVTYKLIYWSKISSVRLPLPLHMFGE